jgi:hypothetical protein
VQVQAITLRMPIPPRDVVSVREAGRWLLFPCGTEAFELFTALELDWIFEGDEPLFAVVEDGYASGVFDAIFDAGLVVKPGRTPVALLR